MVGGPAPLLLCGNIVQHSDARTQIFSPPRIANYKAGLSLFQGGF